jgi:hypothetical protein
VERFILLQHLAKCIFLGEKENDPEYVILIVRQEKKKMEKKITLEFLVCTSAYFVDLDTRSFYL